MILLSHPTGNQFVRNALEAFERTKLLDIFLTGYAGFNSSQLHKFSKRLITDFDRRTYEEKFKPITKTYPLDELLRLAIQRYGLQNKLKGLGKMYGIDNNFLRHDRRAARLIYSKRHNFNVVYSYEDASFFTFQAAKEVGLTGFYDLPIGYWKSAREWYEKAAGCQEHLRVTIRGLLDSEEKIARKEKELDMADNIIVASEFTKSTLENTPFYNKVLVIPYGFPIPKNNFIKIPGKKLKVLFVGSLTQRKGIGDVLSAVRPFKGNLELTIIGRFTLAPTSEFEKEIKSHRWIESTSHENILKEMDNHDVLLFPSWFEGFGLVISESMSRGLPVITTKNTGGLSFIRTNENGFLVEPGDIIHIQQILDNLLLNPKNLADLSINALNTARLRPWENYQMDLVQAVFNGINTSKET